MRQVCKSTIGIFRNLLKKQFDEAMKEVNDTFTHNFSNENHEFSLTIKVDGHQFTALVAESEYSKLKAENLRLQQTCQQLQDKLKEKEPLVYGSATEVSCPRCGHFLIRPEGETNYCTKCQWEDV
jgi:chromosome segregation ATPase